MKTKYAVIAISLFLSHAANAGPYGDELAKCLIESTTKEDRTSLVRWMFASAAAHPAVKSIANVSQKELDKENETTGKLFTKILTKSCKEQTTKALAYEGNATITTSFQLLGQVAATELFSSPEVQKAMSGLEKGLDKSELSKLAPNLSNK
ncbi:hypothetical protein BJP24_11400 [Aeromonas allosaccharophila]|uniref:hypothetical protein n=1 Tax=Aeromonas allosaccharophila TaxID=656 RepID=UPI0005B22015|nr:hypothetical protein [Aeromonas allosaccharophila]OKP44351.1 hypothetical protein BJP24_11400 [Aeromonas allosaccharophila]